MVLSVVSLYQLPPVKFTSCLLPIASKPKKQFLSLKKKVEVIRAAEENRGISIRELGERFNCGKTQIAKIVKDKESLLSLHSRNISSTRVITGGTALVGTQQNIKSYRDANKYLEEVQEFLEQQGHVEDAFKIGLIIDSISFLEVSRSKQTTLDSWLN